MSPGPLRIACCVGTRPEAIKVAPVIHELRTDPRFEPWLITTGQHEEQLQLACDDFDLIPEIAIKLRREGTGLSELTSALLPALDDALSEANPDVVLVQGDTTTTFTAALTGFYRSLPVVHVEAGLRTGDLRAPHPEEGNRRLAAQLTDLHLAPTPRARANLLVEGVQPNRVHVSGNTGIDAFQWVGSRVAARPPGPGTDGRMILVTAHRRESWDSLRSITGALGTIAERFPGVELLVPLHANPLIGKTFEAELGGVPNIVLSAHLRYRDMVRAIYGAHLILTDSGGLQEEAPSIGKPVLVMRRTTERPEAVEAGCARVVGTDADSIVRNVTELLTDQRTYAAMSRSINPYGDGRASVRVHQALAHRYLGGEPPEEFRPTGSAYETARSVSPGPA